MGYMTRPRLKPTPILLALCGGCPPASLRVQFFRSLFSPTNKG
jgi:hypothetical protein